MDTAGSGEPLRPLGDFAPTAITETLAGAAERLGALDMVGYLVDFEQMALLPIPDASRHTDLPVSEPVHGTTAGRAFTERQVTSEPWEGGRRVWAPIMEGPECTGVLAFILRSPLDDETRQRCHELGMLAGAAISIAARYTDLYHVVRRRKPMSLPASMQWDLLPPLRLHVSRATSIGMLEPAYDVGGDCFDHAVNGTSLDLAIIDAMGHGLNSAVVSALALGCYRHDRREGQALPVMHDRLDGALAERFGGEAFATGQLARLDLGSGELAWINAGHPKPLLVRDGRVIAALQCRPSRPWGLGGPLQELATEALQPGDSVLFYTDGLVEGRAAGGEPFGVDRLIDLVEQAAAAQEPSEAILRRLIHRVLDYQDQRLSDDVTTIWLSWEPARGGDG